MVLLGFLSVTGAQAFDAFTVKDIKLEGLQRIAVGTVFNYLPVRIGETFDDERSVAALRELFKTGFFEDIALAREGDVLVVNVVERPAISDVKFEGNSDIDTEQLTDALKQTGLAKGRTFDRSLLDKVEQELQRQYFSRGKYGVKITTEVKPLERNRVDVDIKIHEGGVATIAQINIVGNNAFSDDELTNQLQLGVRGSLNPFSSRDQYSKQKLSADLESLKSYYLDRGYINFNVDSTQISITPDRSNVYITINVSEGDQFTIKEVKLAGHLVVPEAELQPLLEVKVGDLFSRKLVTQSSENISQRFGLEGYAFSNINPVPNVNKESREVSLTFVVDPGKRIYVRRVNIAGNTRTRDDVVRRELRQFEGGWIATDKINRSRERLMRLGYFEEVNVETPSVPGVEDQVDVNITVKERSTGSVQAGVGFSESQGVLFTASISHDNFFGSGKRVSAEVNTSQVNTIYSFLYNNPYYTQEGISRGIRLFYRKTDSSATNTASYNADTYGLNVDYGFPLSEYYRTSLGFGLEHTEIRETSSTPQAYSDFLRDNAAVFDLLKINPGWSYDTRDRAIFPIKGVFNSIDGEVATPGSDLTYYKIATRAQWYHPLSKSWVFYLGGQVGYGGAYGDTTNLPFFENYYAGGVRTVRGFRSNTLGPREEDKPLGGAFKTVGNAELYFPVPFNPEAKTIRLGLFYDTGNVYEDTGDFDTNQFRSSVGISASWMSPIGPMIFGIARPVRSQAGDDTEVFQFTLGAAL